jgi:hypothetical protein
MFHRSVLAALLVFLGTALASSDGVSFSLKNRKILAPDEAPTILHQCSRNTPHGISSYWRPSAADVDVLEKKLVAYLSKSPKPPDGVYAASYLGIVTPAGRLIYASFSPQPGMDGICDGGPQFWGIVFDLRTGKFSDLEFNGVG